MSEKVAILGASDRPERFAYKAFKLLRQYGHEVFPVNPELKDVEGVKVVPKLTDLKNIDTLTLYVRPQISSGLEGDILALKPGRVIFNPGAENPSLQESLNRAGIEWEEACTLVLLNSGQF